MSGAGPVCWSDMTLNIFILLVITVIDNVIVLLVYLSFICLNLFVLNVVLYNVSVV